MEKVVYTFRKNAQEEVRALLSEYMGNEVISIWVFNEGPKGEKRPTKKGLSMASKLIDDLVKAVSALKQETKKKKGTQARRKK